VSSGTTFFCPFSNCYSIRKSVGKGIYFFYFAKGFQIEAMTALSRRKFIGSVAAGTAGISILPSSVIAGLGHKAPSDKLNIAGIGVGGKGYTNLRYMETENIVALCDVDWDYAGKNAFNRWTRAKLYKDFREMFDVQKDIDAVMVATPDHTHALPTVMAMREAMHAFVQKPLTHSVYESRILAETAERYGVATQMGNQGNSAEGIRQICEWIWAGTIGEVTHVDTWTNRPIWPQGLTPPEKSKRVPKTLDWELFVGPANWREYHPVYHPWNWRGWWDFGTGALGDMGCHILDPVFKALNLKFPLTVEASSTPFNMHSAPNAEFVRYEFPRRDNLPKVGMPEVSVNWYDGGFLPPRPDELRDGEAMGDDGGGCIFHGTRGKIMCGTYAANPTLLPTSEMDNFDEPPMAIRRIPDAMEGGHEQDWIRACKESKNARVEASSNFSYAGPLNEMVVMGVLAVRLQSLQRKLEWDGPNMRFKNISPSDTVRVLTKDKFEVQDGDPRFDKDYATLPAYQMAEEWIRHTYRQGWEQI
jgi:predicted dehydrogenase